MQVTKTDCNMGIDPFDSCITIASACNLVFRSNFLEEGSIGIIPPHGYRPSEKQSLMAYQWMSYLSTKENIEIQHGRNVGEKQIGPFKVDGYYETARKEKVVLEFHSCFWHGCPKCYSKQTLNPVCDMTMSDLYMRTLDKRMYLEENGYKYVCKWECDFKREIQESTELKTFVKTLEFVSPLEPREAFLWGSNGGFSVVD